MGLSLDSLLLFLQLHKIEFCATVYARQYNIVLVAFRTDFLVQLLITFLGGVKFKWLAFDLLLFIQRSIVNQEDSS